ncbi:MAG: nucleotidyltransferase domain-containing protein [Candidatus Thermoplasmatota archaeon]|nr:nucleotidyltransferase domain-containing protein [Candidatus Thermoplasmatota archaeon]
MRRSREDTWTFPPEARSEVLRSISPTPEEIEMVEGATIALLDRIDGAIEDQDIPDARTVLTGSVAKGTYLKDPDLDVFVLFPIGTDPDIMKEKGLLIGSKVLEDADLSYAQHPYMHGRFMGFETDVVPAMDIPKGERIITAVDRTPHHTEFINRNLDPGARQDVMLLKAFLKGIGSYGAEDTVSGFSGYLTELFILALGSFEGAIEYLASLPVIRRPPLRSEESGAEHILPGSVPPLDMASIAKGSASSRDGWAKELMGSPLILRDPVDPDRNVASPLSGQTLAHTAGCAADLVREPGPRPFHPFSVRPHDPDKLKDTLTVPSLYFDLPPGPPSRVHSQIKSSMNRLSKALVREGFSRAVIAYRLEFPWGYPIDGAYLKGRAVWYSSIDRPQLRFRPRTEPEVLDRSFRHSGPPVGHPLEGDFRKRWEGKTVSSESGRLYVMIQRRTVDPLTLAMEIWPGIGHGPDIPHDLSA